MRLTPRPSSTLWAREEDRFGCEMRLFPDRKEGLRLRRAPADAPESACARCASRDRRPDLTSHQHGTQLRIVVGDFEGVGSRLVKRGSRYRGAFR